MVSSDRRATSADERVVGDAVGPAIVIPESLPELARALRTEQLPLENYVAVLEARSAELEPAIQAFMSEPERFARLRAEAAALRARWPAPAGRPALFGVAVGIKDVMRVDGLPTTAGSQLPPEVFLGAESACVAALRAAGALFTGKTVSSEFAYFAPGPTHNPHNVDHTPGGSSSGSAAAVASGLCPLALGTQTVGSTIRPAAFCGVVGYKPSYDRISRRDVIALAPSLDHVGILVGDAAGAALAASVLCVNWRPVAGLPRPVFGLPEGPYLDNAGDEARSHFDALIECVRAAGYTVASVPAMPDYDAIRERHNLLVAAEAAHVHEQWFKTYGALYHPKTAALIERGQAVSDRALSEALLGREHLRAALMNLMNSNAIDAWLTPAAVGAAPRGLDSSGDPAMNLPWTHSGLPAVTLPSGRSSAGLPFGLQVVGRWQGDERLLVWAAEIEAHLRGSADEIARGQRPSSKRRRR